MPRRALPVLALLLAAIAVKADPAPVPPEDATTKAEALVRQVYKADYAKTKPADLADLARKLLKLGNETANDPAGKFVLYREALTLSARGGDVTLAMQAAEATARAFAVKEFDMKVAALEQAARAPSAPGKALADTAAALAEQAVFADDYPAAASLLKTAGVGASRASLTPLGKALAGRAKEVEEVRKAFEATEPDRVALKAKPDDPAAAARVGRFLCLMKGDWDAGLPLLAKGSDEKLKSIAQKEMAPGDPVGTGDAWWDLGASLDGVEKAEAQVRAIFWYNQGLGTATGLAKVRAEQRMLEVAKAAELRQYRPGMSGSRWTVLFRSANPAIWNSDTRRGLDDFAMPLAKAPAGVQYLRLTHVAKGESVIIEMSTDRLDKDTTKDGYGWNGTNLYKWNGHHLGIYDSSTATATRGLIAITNKELVGDYRGWGFGHVAGDDAPAHSWAKLKIPSTVFEIAVIISPLTPGETKLLLKAPAKKK